VRRLRRRLRAAEIRISLLEEQIDEMTKAEAILARARLRAAREHLQPVPDDT
jgi:hypothetical protein